MFFQSGETAQELENHKAAQDKIKARWQTVLDRKYIRENEAMIAKMKGLRFDDRMGPAALNKVLKSNLAFRRNRKTNKHILYEK